MANIRYNKVKLAGISTAVPKEIVRNSDNKLFDASEVEKFVESTGVQQFRQADINTCASDLAFHAADKLLNELNWDRSEIDVLIFVSQTLDYTLPVTAALLQDRLKLPTTCLAFDMPLGCSGFVYGLSSLVAYMASGSLKKGLLLCGDTLSKVINPRDKSATLLFGDASSAVALEYDETYDGSISFSLGTDGSGYKAIIIPEGGYRHPFNADSLVDKEVDKDITRNGTNLVLEGMDVFSFGISQAQKSVKELCTYTGTTADDADYIILHQANKMMNNIITKKLKVDIAKTPSSLQNFGNTSSASIPITIVTELQDKLEGNKKLIFCGFGVGLSWASCQLETNNVKVLPLIEI